MLNPIHEVNTEASLVSLDSDDLNSKNMMIKFLKIVSVIIFGLQRFIIKIN
jgi:hypothetical protein